MVEEANEEQMEKYVDFNYITDFRSYMEPFSFLILFLSAASQMHRPLHQATGGECWASRGWGEDRHRPPPWGHCQQDVLALLRWPQIQTGHWHCPGDQATWHVWEDHLRIGQHLLSFTYCCWLYWKISSFSWITLIILITLFLFSCRMMLVAS